MSESRKAHWENVYASKRENEVSWFQESPAPSLALIDGIGATPNSAIIDIGGGASRLVDHLIGRGFHDIRRSSGGLGNGGAGSVPGAGLAGGARRSVGRVALRLNLFVNPTRDSP